MSERVTDREVDLNDALEELRDLGDASRLTGFMLVPIGEWYGIFARVEPVMDEISGDIVATLPLVGWRKPK